MADHTAFRRAAASHALASSTALCGSLAPVVGPARGAASAASGARRHVAAAQIEAARRLAAEGDMRAALAEWSAAVLIAPEDALVQHAFIDSFSNWLEGCLKRERIQTDDAALRAMAVCLRKAPPPPPTVIVRTCHVLHAILRVAGEVAALRPAALDLLLALLSESRVILPGLEDQLLRIRTALLEATVKAAAAEQRLAAPWPSLAEALALQGQETGYLWAETAQETEALETLERRIVDRLQAGAPVVAEELFVLGAYRPLHRIEEVRRWVGALAARAPLDQALSRLVFDRMQDEALAQKIVALTPIEDEVSAAVRDMYEEDPYPRWSRVQRPAANSYLQAISQDMGVRAATLEATSDTPSVLFAGGGSGRAPIAFAMRVPGARVMSVDLSRASLAYGMRRAIERRVQNVVFAQADILKLEGEDNFDMIDSCGVLHHMAEPEAGLSRLRRLLKPGGYMKLALYSEVAREDIVSSREEIARLGFAPDLEGMRAFREHFFTSFHQTAPSLVSLFDFYSAPEFRDLLFHVQEHRFTIPQIADVLQRHGLDFVTMARNDRMQASLHAVCGPDADPRDLSQWARLEEQQTKAFLGMYIFWVRKPAS